jgi:hypothetical protein
MRPHVAIAAAQIPNGPTERAKAVANIHALTYELGLPSIPWTNSLLLLKDLARSTRLDGRHWIWGRMH